MADVGFCEREDVRRVLQESSFDGAIGQDTEIADDAILGVSRWFANATNTWWYDSTGSSSDLVPTSTSSASNVRLDVPSSPHRQDRQLFSSHAGARYPVTHNGPYARIPLPHRYVDTLTTLDVRDRDGGTTDWVADSSIDEGRGNDYYIERRGQDSYGLTYLYIRARTIGARTDYGGLLTLDYDYGLDYDSTQWDDVRRGIATLAAADLALDEDIISSVPDNGQLVSVQTKAERYADRALKRGLEPFLSRPVR